MVEEAGGLGVVRAIAAEVERVSYGGLPRDVIDSLKRALLDYLGVALMGYGMGAPALLAYAKAAGGSGEATIIGDGARVSPGVAAGVNAQFAYNTDFEEAGPGDHAGLMSASLALAGG